MQKKLQVNSPAFSFLKGEPLKIINSTTVVFENAVDKSSRTEDTPESAIAKKPKRLGQNRPIKHQP